MDEAGKVQAETVTLRSDEVLPLDDPQSSWLVETGSVGVYSVVADASGARGQRRFLLRVGAGQALFGVPRAAQAGRPTLVAVALEECRLLRPGGDSTAGGAERIESWMRTWCERVGEVVPSIAREDQASAPDAREELRLFQQALLDRIHELWQADDRQEVELFREGERRSREMTREAVAELASVLEPGRRALPTGSDLFLAAYVVGRAAGITLRRPAAWREEAERTDPVKLIAAASHVRFRKILLHDGWSKQDCGPVLAFTAEEGNAVALLPQGPGKYEMFDPSTRARGPLVESVVEKLDAQAYVFSRPLPENPMSGLELTRFALHGRSRDLLTLLLAGAGATLLGMLTPQAIAWLVDRAIPDSNPRMMWQIGWALLAAAFGSAAFRIAQGIAMIRVETGADVATQSAVWDRLLNLQLSFFRKFSSGDLLSRVTAIGQIRAYLSGTTLRTLFSSVILLLNLGLLLYYSPLLTIVALATAGLSAGVTLGSGVAILKCYRQILELQGRFFGLMVQLINGVAKLRVAAAEDRAFGQWARSYSRLLRLELRQRRIRDGVQLTNLLLSRVSTIVLFAIAASLVRESLAMTTGVFLAFNLAYGTFIGAISSLSNTVTDVMAIAILRERARPILEATPEISDRKADPGRLAGKVEMLDVVFHYRKDGPAILDSVSLKAEPGEFVAIVGPSGSGKSTLFRLLLGFESPGSGTIQFDGQDLGGLDVFAVRRQLGVVLQHGRINAGSLFENIVTGTHVSLNDAWDAARATGFADEIAEMPMGMHTMISEGGTNLSGGQRQRLLLSRALVHKPRVLLLDEATSALDNQTQAVVAESLRRLNVTRLVIAHRLSTIRGTNRICVLDSGRIVQQGTYEELARQRGLFARLIARQLA